jgi:hypothetical protein
LGGALALFSAVRCAGDSLTNSRAAASMLAGATAVAVANLALPGRREWSVEYYTRVLQRPKPLGLGAVVAITAGSGAIVFGGADLLLYWLTGVRW